LKFGTSSASAFFSHKPALQSSHIRSRSQHTSPPSSTRCQRPKNPHPDLSLDHPRSIQCRWSHPLETKLTKTNSVWRIVNWAAECRAMKNTMTGKNVTVHVAYVLSPMWDILVNSYFCNDSSLEYMYNTYWLMEAEGLGPHG